MASGAGTGLCKRCGREFDEAERQSGARHYCTQCALDLAQDTMASEREAAAAAAATHDIDSVRARHARVRRIALVVTAVLCAAVIAWRVPAVVSAVAPQPPVRIGRTDTNAGADACIGNLWKLSAQLRPGADPAVSLTCPVSGKPYVVTLGPGDVVTISCPDPRAHGLTALSVSTLQRVPEVR